MPENKLEVESISFHTTHPDTVIDGISANELKGYFSIYILISNGTIPIYDSDGRNNYTKIPIQYRELCSKYYVRKLLKLRFWN